MVRKPRRGCLEPWANDETFLRRREAWRPTTLSPFNNSGEREHQRLILIEFQLAPISLMLTPTRKPLGCDTAIKVASAEQAAEMAIVNIC
jgi:hypothetical protein